MTILQLSLKLMLFIVTGFAARKLRVMPDGFDKMLSRFVMAIPLPCMIIKSFDLEFSMEDLTGFPLTMGLALGSLAVIYIAARIITCRMRPDLAKTARFALMFANFTFLGLPVVSELYGTRGAFHYVVFTLPVRMLFYGGAPVMLGRAGVKTDIRGALKQFFCAPVAAVFIGFFLYVTQIELPEFIDSAMESLGNTASPLGLILCGAVIADARWDGILRYPSAFAVSALRLVLVPAVALGLDLLLGIDRDIMKPTMFCFAMPAASLLPMFLLRYDPEAEEARIYGSYIVFISTLACMVTIPLWAVFLERF